MSRTLSGIVSGTGNVTTRRVQSFFLHSALIAGALVTLFPLLWMLSASLMTSGEATSLPPHLIPHSPTFAQYRELSGYAFAKLRFRGRDRIFGLLLMALVIPPQVGMLPLFLLMKKLHLVNTYWGAIIPSLSTVFGIFLIRQFMLSVPHELLEAARIDGASELRIWWSIVLPLARPILATLATFMFMSTWNDFMWPLIVLSDQSHYTLPVAIANLSGEHVQDIELMMAGSLVTVLPVLALFVALQRHYIAGLMAGSVKG